MKRKNSDVTADGQNKKRLQSDIRSRFRNGLFEDAVIADHSSAYSQSTPYKHAVVPSLVNEDLLRSVRQEILDNIHFTPKETDIYKIHQSGDLANLDGLPASALEKLPSLLELRDALYSPAFRSWISQVSGAGHLSGTKTDMAVNVYVPGCHLLCHDDVIGSRRVSYILYLTDPEKPWRPEWGGALRLFPTEEVKDLEGKVIKLPRSEWSKSIPPAWNQLSFFAVQPGESFHDVEEVYKQADRELANDASRIRMAISGWFHLPQPGEDGYEPGQEEKLAERSSLQQLQGKAEDFDEPQHRWQAAHSALETESGEDAEDELTQEDLQFLLKFMTPTYLTPDTVEELNELFSEESILQLTNFLSGRFSEAVRQSVESTNLEGCQFRTSRPPHKHHYEYMYPDIGTASTADDDISPFQQVLHMLLPSAAFKKWLSLVTGLTLGQSTSIARRFRKGKDYQLAQGYEGEDPQLEYTLCVTSTSGWAQDDDDEGENVAQPQTNGKGKEKNANAERDNPGGYELYMAGDDADSDDGSDDGVTIPVALQSNTGAGDRRSAKKRSADPAVYQAAKDDEDDGILFSNPASWNTMSIVLRDRGTLKFVKYVSQAAPGDRLDYTGCVEVLEDDDGDADEVK